MIKRAVVICLLILLIPAIPRAFAGSIYDEVYKEYPREKYLIGIGEIKKTGSYYKDRRVAEVLARVELARQIKVRIKEETLDIACEGTPGKILGGSLECKNEFVMVIQQSVDELLVGSKIVKQGEEGDTVYAVAVLPRENIIEDLNKDIEESITRAKENLKKAKEGDKDSLEKAKEEYIKALAYDKEREAIEGVKSRASEAFEELEKELEKLR